MPAPILVAGASGHVGGELVAALAADGRPVRAMTRRPAELRPPDGVDVVAGDAEDPASLDAAFAGVRAAFLMSAEQSGSVPRPRHVPALVEAAVRAGVGQLVLLSTLDGGAGTDVIAVWTRGLEDAVTASGVPVTVLRPGRFMSNALQWAPQIRQGDTVMIPFARRPAASIDPADIAAIAAGALAAPPRAGGVVVHPLSGPQNLRPVDELAVLAEELGRPLTAVEPPVEQVRAGMARGMPPEVVDAVLHRTLDSAEGQEVLPGVEELLGRPARTFADWAAAHRGAFTG